MSKFLAGDPDLRTILGQKMLKNDFVLLKKGLIVLFKKVDGWGHLYTWKNKWQTPLPHRRYSAVPVDVVRNLFNKLK